jgi:hypothetical protein
MRSVTLRPQCPCLYNEQWAPAYLSTHELWFIKMAGRSAPQFWAAGWGVSWAEATMQLPLVLASSSQGGRGSSGLSRQPGQCDLLPGSDARGLGPGSASCTHALDPGSPRANAGRQLGQLGADSSSPLGLVQLCGNQGSHRTPKGGVWPGAG